MIEWKKYKLKNTLEEGRYYLISDGTYCGFAEAINGSLYPYDNSSVVSITHYAEINLPDDIE